MKIAALCLVVIKIFRYQKVIFRKQRGDGVLKLPALEVVQKIGFYRVINLDHRSCLNLRQGAFRNIPIFIFYFRNQILRAEFDLINFFPVLIIGGCFKLYNLLFVAFGVIKGNLDISPIKCVIIKNLYPVVPLEEHLKALLLSSHFFRADVGGGILEMCYSKIENKIGMGTRIDGTNGSLHFLIRDFPEFRRRLLTITPHHCCQQQ